MRKITDKQIKEYQIYLTKEEKSDTTICKLMMVTDRLTLLAIPSVS